MTFPYELVYDHFAKTIITHGLPAAQLPGAVWVVLVKDDDTVHGSLAPHLSPLSACLAEKGRTYIDGLVGKLAKSRPHLRTCIVGVGEFAHMPVPGNDILAPLADNPLAERAVGIIIWGVDGMRGGFLPVASDRQATYRPIDPSLEWMNGRLHTTPWPADAGANTVH